MTIVSKEQLPAFAREVLARVSSAGDPAEETRAFVIALQGDLGSGKTTFMQAFAHELGVEETVQSPTYVLMKTYPIRTSAFGELLCCGAPLAPAPYQKSTSSSQASPRLAFHPNAEVLPPSRVFMKLVHIDAYRLDDPKEFSALKPEQFLQDPHALVCIEWPERLVGVLPSPDLVLKFSSEGMKEGGREIEIAEKNGTI